MEKLKLSFEGRNRPVCNLFSFTVFLAKVAFFPLAVKRIVTALMSSFLFHCFSLFLPHLRPLANEKIVSILLLVGRVSVSIIVAKYLIFLHADKGRSREKKF